MCLPSSHCFLYEKHWKELEKREHFFKTIKNDKDEIPSPPFCKSNNIVNNKIRAFILILPFFINYPVGKSNSIFT